MELIFELSGGGKRGDTLPESGMEIRRVIPTKFLRKDPLEFPEVSEPEVARHYIKLSSLNYHIDSGFYPLGSCTMKYNPKINERIASLEGFREIHPFEPTGMCQGALQIMYELGEYLREIGGMDAISLLPSAGAHGEVVSLLMIKKYFKDRGEKRGKVLVPDSAHGTNPASSALAGFGVVPVPSDEHGLISIDALKRLMSGDVACLMLTCPNTLGLFEREIERIEGIVHKNGGILYLDGANLNAFLGVARPGDMGFDMVHFNLHKTFSTPHGSGGPGGGGVGVKKFMKPLLPIPRVEKIGDRFFLNEEMDASIGRIHSFYSNFGVMVKAWVYIKILGGDGLRKVARGAVLNANYLLSRLGKYYEIPYGRGRCMHEFVLSCEPLRKYGVRALDVAKVLLDMGLHPPTIYFPLIVKEAFMIEPTETESKDTLDKFADAMIEIRREVEESPDVLHDAPKKTPVGRLNEVKAARELNVNWYD